MAYWILKTEPSEYSFADLRRDKRTRWDGITNAQALIHLRAMAKGDEVLICWVVAHGYLLQVHVEWVVVASRSPGIRRLGPAKRIRRVR